ncbi:MAG: NAD(P)H-dependent oxidoreductase subunit E [Candidatus Brocadiales bacterium]|nr:NAD(P)H-dependent oxidoreductase subunit E [Candidatus Bathyanammoxibius amoris]
MPEFSAKTMDKFKSVVNKYPEKGAALLPTLWLAQQEFSAITPEVEEYVAGLVGVSPVRVQEVRSFYTMYTPKPLGKYHLQLCTNISCSLLGAEDILGHLKNKLGINVGETTADGKFTLSTVECLGHCGTAPVIQINDDFHENLTGESLDKILGSLK